MIPRATYRLQFNKGFRFARAAELADYFAALGISHIYASPILTARAGSTHGYNVIDFGHINPELGGEYEFRRMAAVLRARGIGILLDTVPNHMAVGKDDNAWWLDVLKNGRASAYAAYFDIDWDELDGKLLVPFLDGAPEHLLARGDLKLVRDARGTAFVYFDNRFPLCPEDEAALPAHIEAFTFEDKSRLLARQHYILADWREANARINWRRFFDITELAGLRMEYDAAFDAVHAKPLALYAEGLIDGLRIDHIDGLADPRAYCRKLRACLEARKGGRPVGARAEPAYLIVEKILAHNETLPDDWGVDGTTGYDFMEDVSALLHRCEGGALSQLWANISGRSDDFEKEEVTARKEILDQSFPAQRKATSRALAAAAGELAEGVQVGLSALLAELRCYRTYATGEQDTPPPGACFAAAVTAANRRPHVGLHPIGRIMRSTIGSQSAVDAVRRFNQLAAPVAAKAVEDTAFYRYGRLLSRNDVGSNPRFYGLSVAAFHQRARQRAAHFARSMITTATHDHKRGEDARARLAVLSEMPDAWKTQAETWLSAAPPALDKGDVYQLLQTIVGVWPYAVTNLDALATRIGTWCRKFLREAKLRSNWISPATHYEDACVSYADNLVRDEAFRRSVESFIETIGPAAVANSLAQVVLRSTMPGVPDLYQARERWDFSLVDPDNRTPVDFDRLKAAQTKTFSFSTSFAGWRDGRLKQGLVSRLLNLRRVQSDIFGDGDYEPIEITGARAPHVIAFRRAKDRHHAIVAATLHCAPVLVGGAKIVPPKDWWSDTTIPIETGKARRFIDLFSNATVPPGSLNAGVLFETLPVTVLVQK